MPLPSKILLALCQIYMVFHSQPTKANCVENGQKQILNQPVLQKAGREISTE